MQECSDYINLSVIHGSGGIELNLYILMESDRTLVSSSSIRFSLSVYSLQFIYSESRKSLVQLCSIRISIGLVNTI